MDILAIFRDAANRMLHEQGIEQKVDYANENFGDYTLPCFSLAKQMRKSPAMIAKELARNINPDEYFEKIVAAGPYLNFYISTTKLVELTLNGILSDEIFHFDEKEKIIVEHTSANPTGPLHVGRARNPIIGDTIARILREYGHDVEVHYFVNDAGMQVATLLWGMKNLGMPSSTKKCDHAFVNLYQKASKLSGEHKSVENEIRLLMKKYEEGDPELRKFAKENIGCVLDGITKSLNRIHVYIDKFVWESELIKDAKRTANKLEKYSSEENGAYYLSMDKIDAKLQKNKFFLYRKDGTTLYFLRDITYHLLKGSYANVLIDVLGEDHKLHFQALKSVIKKLNPRINIHPLFYSFVRLPEGKMSTRRGRVIYLDDLLEEGYNRAMEIIKDRDYSEEYSKKIAESISASSIRYSILNIQEEKPILFQWEKALSFDGESAPFIIYTYARACSIMRKADAVEAFDSMIITAPQEIKLIKIMAKYPNILTEAAEKLSPYLMAKYAYNLAIQFNQFYRDCPVLSAEKKLRMSRLAIVESFKRIMEHVIKILGLTPLEKM